MSTRAPLVCPLDFFQFAYKDLWPGVILYLLQHNFLFIMAELLHLRISPNLLTRICGLELNCIRYSIISDLSWKHCCTPANISIGILGWTDETTILLVDDIPVIVVQSWVSSISNTSSGHRACQDGGSASSLLPCPPHLVSGKKIILHTR